LKNLVEKYINDSAFLPNFIDFYLQNGVYVKSPNITIQQLNDLFYQGASLRIGLRYASINSLVDRKLIKITK
jgi:hypothetical protein